MGSVHVSVPAGAARVVTLPVSCFCCAAPAVHSTRSKMLWAGSRRPGTGGALLWQSCPARCGPVTVVWRAGELGYVHVAV